MKGCVCPRVIVSLLALPVLAGSYVLPGYAQGGAMLEEVQVTARRRAENLQEIPESVTVLDSDLIENIGATNLKDISSVVPNLSLFTGEQAFRAGVVQIVIRGITTPQNGEAPISFVVDGVTAPEIDFINQDLFDIESVQVLRGPQGALYGRGALGGAILINTKQPSDEFSGFVKAVYEEGDDYRLQAGVSGPLAGDNLFFRLSGSYTDRKGLINNPTIDDKLDFKDSKVLRGNVKWLISDTAELDWNFNYLKSDLGGGGFGIVPLADFNRNFENSVDSNIRGENARDIFETSIKLEWDIGDTSLTSISAYGKIDDQLISDGDFSALASDAQRNATDLKTFTQELRLTSADDRKLRWILGAFYQKRSKEFEFDFAFDDRGGSTAGGSFADRFSVAFEQRDNTDSAATGVFAQLNYDITDRLELTGALRYDRDKRDFEDPRTPSTRTSTSSNELQPKASLSFAVNEDLLTYATYSRGFRSGGFNEIGFFTGDFEGPPTVYKAETSDSIELGVKATLLEGRMTLNAAAFHVELKNNQFDSFDPDTFTLGILGINKAEINGLDLEIHARPTESLDLSLGLGIADSEIKDFDGTGVNDGNRIPYVPKYTLNAGVQYSWALGNDWELLARADYNRVAKFNFGQDNFATTEQTDTLNFRLAARTLDWSLAAYLKNATDERSAVDAFDNGDGTVGRAINLPRAFGVEIRYDF